MKFEYLNKWIVYSWSKYSINRNNKLIHPEDLNRVEQNGLDYSSECVDENSEYITLSSKYGELTRVKREGVFRILPAPRFKIGDFVKEVARPGIFGEVYDFIWHDKDAEYKFYIIVNGKKKSKRYNSSELIIQ